MRSIRRVAVFCGSNFGGDEQYRLGAAALGRTLAERSIELVYGGTHKGLMGALADAVLEADGQVCGVITERLHGKGHLHPGLTEHEIVPTMRERKLRMGDRADAFIALPGGIGTLEEFMETWTLNQLGEIDKPAGLLNVKGFFAPFMHFIDHMIDEGFLPAAHRNGIVLHADPATLLDRLQAFEPVVVPKWIDPAPTPIRN
jgi:uncharacterized protein (TIGR00730 family)